MWSCRCFTSLGESKRNYYNLLSYVGFFLIIFSFIFFDDPHQHPFLTLIPVFGCCLIIIDKDPNSLIHNFIPQMACKYRVNLLRYICGIIQFYHLEKFQELQKRVFFKILLILLSFFLSALTYHMVEKNLGIQI